MATNSSNPMDWQKHIETLQDLRLTFSIASREVDDQLANMLDKLQLVSGEAALHSGVVPALSALARQDSLPDDGIMRAAVEAFFPEDMPIDTDAHSDGSSSGRNTPSNISWKRAAPPSAAAGALSEDSATPMHTPPIYSEASVPNVTTALLPFSSLPSFPPPQPMFVQAPQSYTPQPLVLRPFVFQSVPQPIPVPPAVPQPLMQVRLASTPPYLASPPFLARPHSSRGLMADNQVRYPQLMAEVNADLDSFRYALHAKGEIAARTMHNFRRTFVGMHREKYLVMARYSADVFKAVRRLQYYTNRIINARVADLQGAGPSHFVPPQP